MVNYILKVKVHGGLQNH